MSSTKEGSKTFTEESKPPVNGTIPFIPKPQPKRAPVFFSERFEEFWARHPGKKLRKELAAGVWAHMVTEENEPLIFVCLENYLASAEVARSAFMDPHNWLSEVIANGCTATWPAPVSKARDPDVKNKQQRAAEMIDSL